MATSGLPSYFLTSKARQLARSGASAPVAPSPSSLSQQPTANQTTSQPDPMAISGLPRRVATRSGASQAASDARKERQCVGSGGPHHKPQLEKKRKKRKGESFHTASPQVW